MSFIGDVRGANEKVGKQFGLIGTPVGHSLSPAMHNAIYREADVEWFYAAYDCPTGKDAIDMIEKVRLGHIDGLNVTMPYKRLAMDVSDWADASAKAAGGANVLVRRGANLCAYNTDGAGAVDAIALAGGLDMTQVIACVCGTGPTSSAIACALVERGVKRVYLFSRDVSKAWDTVERIRSYLEFDQGVVLVPASYDDVFRIVPGCDVFVDATPRGMNPDDEPIIDPTYFRSGQVVMDVVYNHGVTAIVEGARKQGAIAIDGSEMLVGQAVLAIQIWQRELGYNFPINRATMRHLVVRE